MIRLRKLRLRPDISHPERPLDEDRLSSLALDSFAFLLDSCDFEVRYALETLITNNAVQLPELPILLDRLSAYNSDEDRVQFIDSILMARGYDIRKRLASKSYLRLTQNVPLMPEQMPARRPSPHIFLITAFLCAAVSSAQSGSSSFLHRWKPPML
jgi:hypothetical protein